MKECGYRSCCPQELSEVRDLIEDLHIGSHECLDLLNGVDHGCVIATTELCSDLREREIGVLPAEVHGDLSVPRERLFSAGTGELFHSR